MKDHSIYTSAYNLVRMGFNYSDTLWNWASFLGGEGQIVIAVNTSDDDTYDVLRRCQMHDKMQGWNIEWTIFKTDIPYSDPLFDGAIKNEALKRCNREFCTLLDMDEVLPLSNRAAWEEAKELLGRIGYDALLLPVIDLFHDEKSYRSQGTKWYLHKNRPYLKRGPVGFAKRADGTIDINRSDSTELIHLDGSLANATMLNIMARPEAERLKAMAANQIPYVLHLGWINKQQRLRQSAFWAPVWSARDGRKVEKPLELADLDKIPHKLHGLKHWNEE